PAPGMAADQDRPDPRHHRPLAGAGENQHPVRGNDQTRLPLRHQLDAVDRRQPDAPHPAGGLPQAGGQLTMADPTVVVLGKGTLAIRVADWFRADDRWLLNHVVPVTPEPEWTDSFADWADVYGVSRVESGHYADLQGAKGRSIADLAVSVFYDRIL